MNQQLSEILKSLREKRNLSKEELASILKTTIAQIEILERGEFKKLPKINLERILEKYENFFKVELKNLIVKKEYSNEEKNIFRNNNYFKLNNPLFYSLIIFLIIILLLVFFQLVNLILPPKIKILYPYDEIVISQRELIIKGYVDLGSILYLNNKEILYDNNGYFQANAILKPGLNKFEFTAKNYLGLSRRIILKVYYQPY